MNAHVTVRELAQHPALMGSSYERLQLLADFLNSTDVPVITSLEGAPEKVRGNFVCSNTEITSLD